MSTIKVDTLQTRAGSTAAVTGAGFVATDQIRGNTSAGSTTVVGEGGSTTTNLQQGLCKCWVNFNSSTFGVSDSFNLTGATDNGTGDYTVTIANDMGNANYSATATGYKPSADFGFITNNNQTFFAAGTLRVETVEHDGGHKQTEFTQLCISFNGDLA